MNEPIATGSFASKLLDQDDVITSDRYKEHRMQLENQLAKAESQERWMKRVAMGSLVVAAAVFPILASRVFGGPDPYDKDATILSVGAGVIYAAALAVFFLGTASYYSRFLPRVRHAREAFQQESLHELRREIADLRRLVENELRSRGESSAPAKSSQP